MTEEERKALETVLSYLWGDEARGFEEWMEEEHGREVNTDEEEEVRAAIKDLGLTRNDHVFVAMYELDDFLYPIKISPIETEKEAE